MGPKLPVYPLPDSYLLLWLNEHHCWVFRVFTTVSAVNAMIVVVAVAVAAV